ncbi:uncharacterized protein PV09_00918 [Verruconis gallopava]|uniref:Uncharacterized protein n=1 Tax=Verruconis gallopava TaxID=253628 RepID=A0A0D2BCF3_9PEZI|nr:uncharacterized protein PV09_00918 [Verruconis gallopava]KIW09024.1 hypothetical protein PV09_00918 [Verruconis gallopava]
MRDRTEVAEVILEICLAQYSPEKKDERNARYIMAEQHDNDCRSESSCDVHVYEEINDDKFSTENIGAVSLEFDSHVAPLDYLSWFCPAKTLSDRDMINTSRSSSSLLGYALDAVNEPLFSWLLKLGKHYNTLKTKINSEYDSLFYSFKTSYLQQAIQLGNTRRVIELIKSTGCGIPFEDLVKSSGVQSHESSKYYQGLSVYGRKRADWAAAGRQTQIRVSSGTQISPLLLAAQSGTLEILEYFLSDTPLRLYQEFLTAYKDDMRVKRLSRGLGGVHKAISDWYHANQEYLLFFVLAGTLENDSEARLEYVIRTFPGQIESQLVSGETPL